MGLNSTHVLLIEDDPDDLLLLRESLAEVSALKIELTHADRLSEGLKHIAEGTCDIILLDLNLPDSRGLDTLRVLLQQTPTIPVVVLSGLADDVTTLEAIRQGAQDYLVKGEISGSLLGRVLSYAIERKKMEQSLREHERQLSSIYETVGDIIFQLVAEGQGQFRFVSVNRSFLSTTGLRFDQIVGKRVQEVIPEPSLTMVLEKYEQAIRQKKIVRPRWSLHPPGGRSPRHH